MGGGILYDYGIELFSKDREYYDADDLTDKDVNLYPLIEFVGCSVSVLFLVSHSKTYYRITEL